MMHQLKKKMNSLLNFGSTMYKFMQPKLVSRVLDQFNECNKKAPGMWSVYNQALQQDPETKSMNPVTIKENNIN